VLGPAPAAISKIRDKFRWHTILKAPKTKTFKSLMDFMDPDLTISKGVQIIVDVDPGNML